MGSWYTYDDGTGKLRLKVNLKVMKIDYTAWDTTGSFGYWMGLGFNKTVMAESDIVLCRFSYTGQSTDKCVCTDRFANFNSEPTTDQKDNVKDEGTNLYYETLSKFAYIECIFSRLLDTSDPTQDYIMSHGSNFNAIWAHGKILSGTIMSHDATTSMRNSFRMYLSNVKATFGIELMVKVSLLIAGAVSIILV